MAYFLFVTGRTKTPERWKIPGSESADVIDAIRRGSSPENCLTSSAVTKLRGLVKSKFLRWTTRSHLSFFVMIALVVRDEYLVDPASSGRVGVDCSRGSNNLDAEAMIERPNHWRGGIRDH